MEDTSTQKLNYLKASSYTGNFWLRILCFLLVLLVITYLLLHHFCPKKGMEYVQLDKVQLKVIKRYLDAHDDKKFDNGGNSNPDTSGKNHDTTQVVTTGNEHTTSSHGSTQSNQPKNGKASTCNCSTLDSTHRVRTKLILDYLDDDLSKHIITEKRADLDSALNKMNNQDAFDYLSDKKLVVQSTFWLIGSDIYLEVFFWSLFGVIVSLIFYVSIANYNTLKAENMADIGPFSQGDIPNQVAKMFYAPAVTIVVVLGYHFFSDKNNTVDINVGTGTLVFSFISGFYSGRLMKFLDKLKDTIFPNDGKNDVSTNVAAIVKRDVTIRLKLSSAVMSSPNINSIKTQINKTILTIKGVNAATDPIKLNATVDPQGNASFTAKALPVGSYVFQADLSYTVGTNTIPITSKQSFSVTSDTSELEMTLG